MTGDFPVYVFRWEGEVALLYHCGGDQFWFTDLPFSGVYTPEVEVAFDRAFDELEAWLDLGGSAGFGIPAGWSEASHAEYAEYFALAPGESGSLH